MVCYFISAYDVGMSCRGTETFVACLISTFVYAKLVGITLTVVHLKLMLMILFAVFVVYNSITAIYYYMNSCSRFYPDTVAIPVLLTIICYIVAVVMMHIPFSQAFPSGLVAAGMFFLAASWAVLQKIGVDLTAEEWPIFVIPNLLGTQGPMYMGMFFCIAQVVAFM